MKFLSYIFFFFSVALLLGALNVLRIQGLPEDIIYLIGLLLPCLLCLGISIGCSKLHRKGFQPFKFVGNKTKDLKNQIQESKQGLNIIKTEKFKSYSVADELTKWADLKEKGLVTVEEFNEAKKKLLKQG